MSEDVALTRKQQAIVALLSEQPGRVYARSEIAERVLGYAGYTNAVRVHVARIRASLGPDAVRTVYDRGYTIGSAKPCEACGGSGYVG